MRLTSTGSRAANKKPRSTHERRCRRAVQDAKLLRGERHLRHDECPQRDQQQDDDRKPYSSCRNKYQSSPRGAGFHTDLPMVCVIAKVAPNAPSCSATYRRMRDLRTWRRGSVDGVIVRSIRKYRIFCVIPFSESSLRPIYQLLKESSARPTDDRKRNAQ
jgi:hypothetical protein